MCLILVACGSQKEMVTSLEEQMIDAPFWVTDRPISSFEYIGIGKASKRGAPEEYQAIARRNALNDMATEIDVTVTSNSLLHTLERNDMLTESFSESIITRSNLRLEGFEVTDDYQNEEYYWVYYRLDKQLYEQIKAQRKQEAMERAFQMLSAARTARESAAVGLAAQQYVLALKEMRPHWGEVNTKDGIQVDRVAMDELLQLTQDLDIDLNSQEVYLNSSNDFRHRLEARSVLGTQTTTPQPFAYRFDKERKEKTETDVLTLTLRPQGSEHSILSIEMDPFKDLRKEVRREGMAFLEQVLRPKIALLDIYTQYPDVSIEVSHSDLNGEQGTAPGLRSAIVGGLTDFQIPVDDGSGSAYRIVCRSMSRDGGMTQQFHIVYTDVDIIAIDAQGATVNSTRLESVKGVHNSLENAHTLSLEKCAEQIDEKLLEPLIHALF
ncbi:MAG: LPP20 family lipoprotein [Flavobacteriales bacterium]|nr:LPP20 family lipoprotein [Flavobacteriales bacterium]